MQVIVPITVNDAALTSSTIPEPDLARGEIEWVAGAYNTGDERIKSSTHILYRVVATPSTSDDPEVGVLSDPPTWSEISYTNRYAMFDNKNSTQSIAALNLGVTITPSKLVNSVAGFNITGAESINVTVNDGVSDIYSRDISMIDNSARINAYEYFFSPLITIDKFVLTDLPPVFNSGITITSSTAAGDIGFGNLVLGQVTNLGVTLYGTGVQGLDFSVRESDGFGGFNIVKRGTADLMDYDCVVQKTNFSYVKNQLKSLSQVPTVWVGNALDVNDGTTVFGYYNDYKIDISSPSVIDMSIQVQELI